MNTKVGLLDRAFIGARSSARPDGRFTPALSRARRVGATALGGVWQFLVTIGQVRARSEMLRMAEEYQSTRPELAARLRAAARESWLA